MERVLTALLFQGLSVPQQVFQVSGFYRLFNVTELSLL